MKKQFACISAFAVAAASLLSLAQPMTASAAGVLECTPYQIRIVPDRTSVSAAEVAQGDVTIPASIYVTGSTAHTFNAVKIRYQSSDDRYLYFSDLVTGDTTYDTQTTYHSSVGDFTTNRQPFCFGSVNANNGRYTKNGSSTTTQVLMDPKFGATIYSAGPNRVYFKTSDGAVWNEATNSYVRGKQEFLCNVTVDENGTGSFTYHYINFFDQSQEDITVTIPRYDATIPAYDSTKNDQQNAASAIPGACDRVFWLNQNDTSFLGNASDEFPFCRVNLVISKDTPSGVYDINFSSEKLSSGSNACEVIGSSNKDIPFETLGTSIAVGVEDAEVVSILSQKDAAFYTADDNDPILATDFASGILANLKFADGTTEENVDITNLVDCYGITPKKLYDNQAKDGFYASENAPLYYNGKVLKQTDGSAVTQNILVGMKGDVDFDGDVTINDAYLTLCYYAEVFAGKTPSLYSGSSSNSYAERLAIFLADTDTYNESGDPGCILIDDARNILQYYSDASAGASPSWNGYIK